MNAFTDFADGTQEFFSAFTEVLDHCYRVCVVMTHDNRFVTGYSVRQFADLTKVSRIIFINARATDNQTTGIGVLNLKFIQFGFTPGNKGF
jgi:hypothetical protein